MGDIPKFTDPEKPATVPECMLAMGFILATAMRALEQMENGDDCSETLREILDVATQFYKGEPITNA